MKDKTMIAIFASALMLASCFAIAFTSPSDTEAVTSDGKLEVGDAWGMGVSLRNGEVFELDDDDGATIPADRWNQLMNEIRVLPGVNQFDIGVGVDGALMAEAVYADENGYAVELDGVLALELDLLVDVEFLPTAFFDGDDTVDFPTVGGKVYADLHLKVFISVHGKIFMDKNYAITALSLEITSVVKISGQSNIQILVEDDDDDITFKYNGEKRGNIDLLVHSYSSISLTSETPLTIIPFFDLKRDMAETTYEVKSDILIRSMSSAYVKGLASGNLGMAFVSEIMDDGASLLKFTSGGFGAKFTGFAGMSAVRGFTTILSADYKVTAKFSGDDDDEKYDIKIEGLLGGASLSESFTIEYPFGTFDDDDDDIAIEKLTGDGKSKVSGIVDSVNDRIGSAMSGVTFKVKFNQDGDTIATQDVGYKGLLTEPSQDLVAIPEGMQLVGWKIPVNTEWDFAEGVRSNMVLTPIFAKVVEGVDDVNFTPEQKIILLRIRDAGALTDADYDNLKLKLTVAGKANTDLSLAGGVSTLYVEILGEDGSVAYKWKFVPGMDDETRMVDTKFNLKTKVMDTGETTVKAKVEANFKEKMNVALHFDAKGVMPQNTEVSVDVSSTFKTGSLDMYYVNGHGTDDAGDDTLEYVGTYSVKDGSVNLRIAHCSDYLLVENPQNAGEETDWLLIGVGAAIAVAVVVGVVFYMRK